jgi:protein O-GlcNAc transferase
MTDTGPRLDPPTAESDRLVPPVAGEPVDLETILTVVRQCIARGDLQRARLIGLPAARAFPGSAQVLHDLAVIEALLGNTMAAITNEEMALLRNPGLVEAEQNLVQLRARRAMIETILSGYRFHEREKAALDPDDRAALYLAIGRDFLAINEMTSAAAFIQRSFSFKPADADALVELGTALVRSDRLHDGINAFRRAVALDPMNGAAIGSLIRALQDACLWQELASFRSQQQAVIASLTGKAAVAADRPFANLHASEDPAANRRAAARYSALLRARQPLVGPTAPAAAKAPDDGRLRIGYLSGDFRSHPVGQLAASVVTRHDRGRFAVHAYSVGADDRSPPRQAIQESCDVFRDLRTAKDSDIAEAIAADGIQILVDLNGYTQGCRPGVMVLQPAPIQVWALGFPGTSGSDFIDYIVADRTVLPPEHVVHFSEQPCWLPDACHPVDDRTEVATEPVNRAELGLPDGFLFVSWQNPIKIEPRVFDLWMDILATVPDSHLWLRAMPEYARRNLGIEARRRKIDPDRIVCAAETAREKSSYLRNLGCADLALDTLVYNGQTTTSDLLRAGVPVITMLGNHFAGRVAASLLQAACLSELVTYSPRAYRDLAVKLARDPARLAALRTRLADLRQTAPLFDTARYVRALERGYEAMWARHQAGQKPAAITVDPEP